MTSSVCGGPAADNEPRGAGEFELPARELMEVESA